MSSLISSWVTAVASVLLAFVASGPRATSSAASAPSPTAYTAIAASPAPALVTANAASAGGEFRAFWVDAFGEGIYTPSEVDQLVAAAKAANMNAIVAQVVRRGDCLCNDASVPRTEAPVAARPYDPLRTLIEKAHAQGIEVHAWVIVTGLWQGTTPPKDPSHPFNLHGPSASGTANWIDYRYDGQDRIGSEFFLDPGHPDAAQWVVDMATSIVRNYDVDGINLDRIRYPDSNLGTNVPSWGYNPTALARFQADTGRTDRPAPGDAQWTQWRRDRVTDLVRRIYVEATALRPRIRVSVDTIAYGYGPQSQGGWANSRTYAEVLQDWVGWLREGIVDLNIPMIYKRDGVSGQREQFSEWAEFTKEQQYSRQAAIGSALYLNDIPASLRQLRSALAPSGSGKTAAGWVGYSYRNPDDAAVAGTRSSAASRTELTKALTTASPYDAVSPAVFASPAAVPAMPWKAAPTSGIVRGTVAGSHATVELRDSGGRIVKTTTSDASGWFGFVDVAPGSYTVRSAGTTLAAAVTAGAVVTASPVSSGTCQSSAGPGIAPPASVPSGLPGFHAAWYGQSGYPTLCPGERATAVVAFYNSGSLGWVRGRMGEVAYLGTWNPVPGQDRPSTLGGDGTNGSPSTGWPRYDRVALQPAEYVGPGQIAWFQFTIQAPSTPGTYRLAIRPLIEGAQWLEDYGVFWYVTVR